MDLPIYQVDAFTDKPFSGNPAAVCLLTGPRDSAWMQALAAEMNLSETAFLYQEQDGYRLRWFTPAMEVDLCGHATLASAHTLWTETDASHDEPLTFFTKSGELTATRSGSLIELDFPAERAASVTPPAGLIAALGIDESTTPPRYVGRNRMDYLVEVASEQDLRALQPDFGALANVDVRGTIVTSRAAQESYDFVSRFFAPRAGVNEDPVTGSAHCCLGPYWQQQCGQQEMRGRQISARGGDVHVRLAGDRVILGGTAVTVFRGMLSEVAATSAPR